MHSLHAAIRSRLNSQRKSTSAALAYLPSQDFHLATSSSDEEVETVEGAFPRQQLASERTPLLLLSHPSTDRSCRTRAATYNSMATTTGSDDLCIASTTSTAASASSLSVVSPTPSELTPTPDDDPPSTPFSSIRKSSLATSPLPSTPRKVSILMPTQAPPASGANRRVSIGFGADNLCGNPAPERRRWRRRQGRELRRSSGLVDDNGSIVGSETDSQTHPGDPVPSSSPPKLQTQPPTLDSGDSDEMEEGDEPHYFVLPSQESSSSLTDPTKRLRLELNFFFMNPIEKWEARKQFPWKLCVQLLKIILVTIQVVLFGNMRISHISYTGDSKLVFRHLFLNGWDTTRDITVYPPANGPFAVFTYDDLYFNLLFAVRQYVTINETALGSFDYDYRNSDCKTGIPALKLCQWNYAEGKVFPFNATYVYDTRVLKRCGEIPLYDLSILNDTNSFRDFLQSRNMSLNCDKLERAVLSIPLKSIHLKNLEPYNIPDCFQFAVEITIDNGDHNGQVVMDLEAGLSSIVECHGHIKYGANNHIYKALLDTLDVLIIFFCLFSLFLCARAVFRAERLKSKTVNYFERERNVKLRHTDKLKFLNLGYVVIIVDDCLIILGSLFKLSIEFRLFDSGLFTAAGIMLGVGNLLAWCGVLRYMGFFSQYNVLILTLKKSLPNILRFLFCAALIYFGFLFCGWLVFGPYHYKFRNLMSSSECLFSLINGDDMFATFNMLPYTSPAVWWFSRIYLYTFISLFIYVVLSLFIAIIMDSYEVIKEVYDLNLGVKTRAEEKQRKESQAQFSKKSTANQPDISQHANGTLGSNSSSTRANLEAPSAGTTLKKMSRAAVSGSTPSGGPPTSTPIMHSNTHQNGALAPPRISLTVPACTPANRCSSCLAGNECSLSNHTRTMTRADSALSFVEQRGNRLTRKNGKNLSRTNSISGFFQYLTRERYDVGNGISDLSSFLEEDRILPNSNEYLELGAGVGCFNLIQKCFTSYYRSARDRLSGSLGSS